MVVLLASIQINLKKGTLKKHKHPHTHTHTHLNATVGSSLQVLCHINLELAAHGQADHLASTFPVWELKGSCMRETGRGPPLWNDIGHR